VKNVIVQKAVLRRDDGKFLWLRRSKTDVRRPGDSDIPGGQLDPGESLEEGVQRELQEEVGLVPTELILRYTASTFFADQSTNRIHMIYVGTVGLTEVSLSYEHDKFEWLDKEEFRGRFSHLPHYVAAFDYIFNNQLEL
jgi:8-oxo-dGTP diphosphatase